jgi:hypothetical protein
MKCRGKAITNLAVVMGLSMAGLSSAARADLAVRLTEAGGPGPTVVLSIPGSNPTGSFTGVFGDFQVTITGLSANTPGSPGIASLSYSSMVLQNLSGATHTLTVEIGATNFVAPVGLTTFKSHAAVTVGANDGGAGQTLTVQSYVNTDNGLFSTTGFTPGLQTLNITAPGSDSSDAQVSAFLTAPYSIVDPLTAKVDPGKGVMTGEMAQSVPVPVPATMTCAFAGLVSLGVFRLRAGKRVARRGPRGAGN